MDWQHGTIKPAGAYRVNVRSGAGTNFAIVGQIDREAACNYLLHGQWTRIQTSNTQGYVCTRFVSVTPVEPDSREYVIRIPETLVPDATALLFVAEFFKSAAQAIAEGKVLERN